MAKMSRQIKQFGFLMNIVTCFRDDESRYVFRNGFSHADTSRGHINGGLCFFFELFLYSKNYYMLG
jgi:hypothetical protein